MSINPQVHPGYKTTFNFPNQDEVLSNCCLYPIEQATIPSTKMVASCMEEHPCIARICALPITVLDTACMPVVLCTDTVWSAAGTVVSGTGALSSCCQWDAARQATKDFANATVNNIAKFGMNLCIGPVLSTSMAIAACKTRSCKPLKTSLLCCPMFWPLTSIMDMMSICTDPKKTGESMNKHLSEIYDDV